MRDGNRCIYPPQGPVLHARVYIPLRNIPGELLVLTIIIEVDRPAGQAIGIKEDVAMYLERFGDARVVEVRETAPEQLKIK